MDARPRHWVLALLGAVALHASALVLFWEPSQAGTPAPGNGGIEVALGPAGAPAGGLTAATDVEAVEPVQATAPAAAVTPTEVIPTEMPPETVEAEPVETVPAVAPTAPQPVVEPIETSEPVEPMEIAEAVPPPEPVSEPKVAEAPPLPEPPPVKPAPPKPVAKVEPQPVAPPTVAETVAALAASKIADTPAPIQTAALPGNAGVSGDAEPSTTGTQDATPGGGMVGAPGDSYNGLLSAWLQKHHEFPARAQRRNLYGATRVRFTIDRDGKLLGYEILASSGHRILDEAAIATLKRAEPFPPMPADLPGAQYAPDVEIKFTPPT
jgi:protein TonB